MPGWVKSRPNGLLPDGRRPVGTTRLSGRHTGRPSGDIGGVIEHRDDREPRHAPVGDPITAGFQPKPARAGQTRIWARSREADAGRTLNRLRSLVQRHLEVPKCFEAAKILEMPSKFVELLFGFRGELDHRRGAAPRSDSSGSRDASRPMLSLKRAKAGAIETVCPSTSCRSLLSSAAAHSASDRLVGSLMMTGWHRPPVMSRARPSFRYLPRSRPTIPVGKK